MGALRARLGPEAVGMGGFWDRKGTQRDVIGGPDTVSKVLSHRMRKGPLMISIHPVLVREAVRCQ